MYTYSTFTKVCKSVVGRTLQDVRYSFQKVIFTLDRADTVDIFVIYLCIDCVTRFKLRFSAPAKQETLRQCRFHVGPPSATLAQHETSIGTMYYVC